MPILLVAVPAGWLPSPPAKVLAQVVASNNDAPTADSTRHSLTESVPTGEAGDVPLLLDLDAAARALAVSRRTVERLTADGELATVTIGTSRRVTLDDLRELVERRRSRGPLGGGGVPPSEPSRTAEACRSGHLELP